MMKALLKFKWPISILVIIVIALSLIFSPNLSQLAKEKGEIKPPSDTTSQKYEQMLKDVGANSNSMVAVIDLKKPINSNGNDQLESYIKKN